MLRIQTLIVGQLQTNCYLVWDDRSQEALIVDPGDDAGYISDAIASHQLHPVSIFLTHGHFDHILAAFELAGIYAIPVYMHTRDEFLRVKMQESGAHFLKRIIVEPPPKPSKQLQKESTIACGSYQFTILETPGHTPGGVSLYNEKEGICFTGDTVFAGGAIGDWHHGYSDKHALILSVRKILSLPGSTVLYPGHGEQTTVGMAKLSLGRQI